MTTVMNPDIPVESRELESSSPDQAENAPIIERGVCHCMFVYDIGSAIDLEAAATLATQTTHRETLPIAEAFAHEILRMRNQVCSRRL